ncbi:hypothetical protein ACQJBY_059893 [Aegilops geniculata]
MPKKRNQVGRDGGVLKAPKGGGCGLNILEGRNSEYRADQAEKEGLTVFRGASIVLTEVKPNLFATDITVGYQHYGIGAGFCGPGWVHQDEVHSELKGVLVNP